MQKTKRGLGTWSESKLQHRQKKKRKERKKRKEERERERKKEREERKERRKEGKIKKNFIKGTSLKHRHIVHCVLAHRVMGASWSLSPPSTITNGELHLVWPSRALSVFS
jgi:hypothetical protein